jgi:general secretion pathway protein M
MMAFWQGLQTRERLILLIGVPLAVLLLGWALLWQPLGRERLELGNRVNQLGSDLAWLRQSAAQLQGATTAVPRFSGSALSAVESGLTAARLNAGLKQLSPVGEGRVRVVLEAVSFDALLAWLEALERDYGLGAEEFSARQVAPGASDVTLVLKPAGGG